MTSHDQDPLIGTRLGDYKIEAVLGRGGMARVYRGIDVNLGRAAAVKVLQMLPNEPDEYATIVERFKLEARAIASFDHPNIVAIYQFGEENGQLFIAMKLIEGKDNTLALMLRRASLRGKRIPVETALQVVGDVSAALDYAHKRHIIHRDIKPSNILIDEWGRAILTDFGLALRLDSATTRGTAFGTPRYIAPEQALASKDAVPQSDIYSLGVIVYEMVTGQTPFDDESPMNIALQHITTQPPSPRSINPDLPAEAEAVILHALNKDPAERFATAGEFDMALHKAFGLGIDTPALTAELIAGTRAAVSMAQPAPETLRKSDLAWVPAPDSEHTVPEPPTTQVLRPRRGRRIMVLMVLIVAVSLIMVALINLSGTPLVLLPTTPVATVTVTDVPAPTTTLAAISAGGGLGARLLYTDRVFALYNPNNAPLNLDDIVLVRGDVTYPGTRFNGPLPPQECALIYLREAALDNPPAECAAPSGVHNREMLLDATQQFWVPGDGLDAFEVRAGDQVLARCSMGIGVCDFSLP